MSTAPPGDDPWEGTFGALSALAADSGPTVRRLLLGTQLRRLREAAGVTRVAAGDAIRGSHTKISRLELGQVGFKHRDVADLLTLYGVTDEARRKALLAWAQRANEPGWWHDYSDVLPSWFETYLGLEDSASVIRSYEIQFVPGLFQTEDYTRAVSRLSHQHIPNEVAERRVSLRAARQRRLFGGSSNTPRLWAVVDEAALRRPLGGPKVMRRQLQRLIELTDAPNIALQLVPFHVGGHAAAGGPFIILRFTEPELPDVVYLEQLTSAVYLDKPDQVDYYAAVMESLATTALPLSATADFLNGILKET